MTIEEVVSIITQFQEIEESPHFEARSFRVKKKIALTIHPNKMQFVVKLTPEQQSVFMAFDSSIVFPAAGKWGQSGWTVVDLTRVFNEVAVDIIRCSYCNVAPPKLADLYRVEGE